MVGRELPQLGDAVAAAFAAWDERGSARACRAMARRARRADAAELSAGLERLVPVLDDLALGIGVAVAQLAAGLIELGADPAPALAVLSRRIADGLERAAEFDALRSRIGDLRAPRSRAEADALRTHLLHAAPEAGLDAAEAATVVQAWFTISEWIPALLLPLQQKRARAALPGRERLTAAVTAVRHDVEDATWLLGLLQVLDDEEVVVVHHATGCAYAVTISGVGDNVQFQTLLAATLIGDPAAGLVPGTPPRPEWVAAATDGRWNPRGGVPAVFRLSTARGPWPAWETRRPSDIPVMDGRRVVVLDPPDEGRRWSFGRAYPLMPPEIRLVRVLDAAEAARWAGRLR